MHGILDASLINVAPRAGAWIEINVNRLGESTGTRQVAPRAGAWIEISVPWLCRPDPEVAPRAGAWIEINRRGTAEIAIGSRSPCGSVD